MKRLIGLLAVLLLALPMAASANNHNGKGGQPIYQVSGGGQVVADGSLQGPGDTIAFVAQLLDEDDSEAARGQLQVVRRPENGNGNGNRPDLVFHGRVTCVVPGDTDDTARFGGEGTDRRGGEESEFVVDVMDADDQGNDMIVFRLLEDDPDRDSPCDDEEDADTDLRETRLARGNVKIHDRR